MKFLSRVAPVAFLSLLATAFGVIAGTVKRADVCNGHPELCSKTYGQVTFVGAHNSYAVDATSLSANQEYDVLQQLKDGIRLLQIQAHLDSDKQLHLCHESCLLYQGGLLKDYLVKVKGWLDSNPNEVLSILIVNIDNQSAVTFAAIYEAAGLVTVAFLPASQPLTFTAWPTLGSMIDSGRRLITFLDNSADPGTVPYLLDEFTQIWETPFDVTTNNWPCIINRTRGDPTTEMYLINHYLDSVHSIVGAASSIAPDKASLDVTNAVSGYGSLGQEVQNCQALYNRPPNFLLVDFYNYGGGSVFAVAASINGVTYTPTSPVPPPLDSSTSSSSANSSDNGVITKPLGSAPASLSAVNSLLLGAVAFGAYILV
jgi:hypothetical protein